MQNNEDNINDLDKLYQIELNEDNNNDNEILFLIKKKYSNLFPKNITYSLSNINTIIDNEIYNCCKHFFINDYIDITLDNSMSITYCKYCYMNKR